MSKYSKKEIINGIINFDKEIYKYLDAMYREKIIQHVCKNSGIRKDGEELYQDVIFEIYLNIKRGRYTKDGPKLFEGYFWTIAKRRWISILRRRKLIFEPLESSNHQIPSNDEAEEVAETLKTQRILAIEKCLAKLVPEEQEYIRLYYFAKKSIQAIADYFGTTYKYAQQKLHRIREKLRKMIGDDPEFGISLF